jgi:hypothetical protein
MVCSANEKKHKHRQAELSQRGAAGLSATTKGRSRVFKNKKKYSRKAYDPDKTGL